MPYAIDYSWSNCLTSKERWRKHRAKVETTFGRNIFKLRYEHESEAQHLAQMIRRECGVNVSVLKTHSVGLPIL